jgi:hypothetical protein
MIGVPRKKGVKLTPLARATHVEKSWKILISVWRLVRRSGKIRRLQVEQWKYLGD